MKFQKSACIETMYRELPFYDRIAAAGRDGFEFVEFWSWEDKDLNAVKEAAAAAGVGILGFNGDEGFSIIDPSQREAYLARLRRSVDAARRVGARSVAIHSNALDGAGHAVDTFNELSDTVKICTMFDTLRACAEIAEGSGILMNLEPLNIVTDHIGNYLTTTRMAAELTRMVGSPMVRVLYDVYHMQLNEGNLCGNIRSYGDQFGHVHVADTPGHHEPGTGEINYHRVFACLEEIGYHGLIGFEFFPETTTARAVEAIRQY